MRLWPFSRKKSAIQNQQVNHPAELAAFIQAFGGRETLSKINVTPENAISVPAINRGVHLMSDMVAMLPLKLYQRLADGGKQEAKSHRQYKFIHSRPNDFQSAYQFRYLMQRHLILRGKAFAFKVRTSGFLQRLNPIHPNRVEVEQDDNFNINFKVTMPSGLKRDYGPKDIFYLCPHSEDGFTGLGIVDEAPEAIALCIAAEQHGAMLFGNGAKPSGILRTDQKVGGESLKLLKESWNAAHGGEKKFGTAAMDNGWDWKEVGMTNEHAQYTEVRSFQVAEAARLLGIPPILLFHSDTTSTFASAKELVLAFLKFSLDPWLTYWETAYNQDILNQEQNGRYYVEFVRQGIEKMDLESQMKAYVNMVQNKISNVNEIRKLMNWSPRPGGDKYENPNITPEGQDNFDAGTEIEERRGKR